MVGIQDPLSYVDMALVVPQSWKGVFLGAHPGNHMAGSVASVVSCKHLSTEALSVTWPQTTAFLHFVRELGVELIAQTNAIQRFDIPRHT